MFSLENKNNYVQLFTLNYFNQVTAMKKMGEDSVGEKSQSQDVNTHDESSIIVKKKKEDKAKKFILSSSSESDEKTETESQEYLIIALFFLFLNYYFVR